MADFGVKGRAVGVYVIILGPIT